MTAQITFAQADLPGRRMAVSLSALAGIGYAAAWIISLSAGRRTQAWPTRMTCAQLTSNTEAAVP